MKQSNKLLTENVNYSNNKGENTKKIAKIAHALSKGFRK